MPEDTKPVYPDLHLKRLKLVEFCNYEHAEFDFTRPDGSPYPFICFYGPNGIGKSTLLEAIMLLNMNAVQSSPARMQVALRRFARDENYDPSYQNVRDSRIKRKIDTETWDNWDAQSKDETKLVNPDGNPWQEPTQKDTRMLIEGIYGMNGREYVVSMNELGFIRNDLMPIPPDELDQDAALRVRCSGPWRQNYMHFFQRIAHQIKADSGSSMVRFQLHKSRAREFEEIVGLVTGLDTICAEPTGMLPEEKEYCIDFVIVKERGGKKYHIHFKRMSDGERKICKAFSDLLNRTHDLAKPGRPDEIAMPGWPRLVLLDNLEMHVYYKRHVMMVDCLKRVFARQQIFATTHSGTLIERFLAGKNDRDREMYIDLEPVNNG